jgi:hypothetical protein
MCSFQWLKVPTVAVWCLCAFGQTPQEEQTIVNPLPDEEILQPCQYQMVLPETMSPIRAAWVIFDRGQDYLQWFRDRRVRAFASEHHLALVLAMHCRSKEREDMIVLPDKGVGRALFSALGQFADSERRPELKSIGIIAMGWSGAGSLVGRLAGYRPERYVAGIAYAPGQYEPLGMDTIELSDQAMSSPQLIIANGGDNINGTERPYGYFKKYYERGAPWTFVVQNRTPHCCLQNAQTLILESLGVWAWETTDTSPSNSPRLSTNGRDLYSMRRRVALGPSARPNAENSRLGGCRLRCFHASGSSLLADPLQLRFGSRNGRLKIPCGLDGHLRKGRDRIEPM